MTIKIEILLKKIKEMQVEKARNKDLFLIPITVDEAIKKGMVFGYIASLTELGQCLKTYK